MSEARASEDRYLDDPCPCGAVLAFTGEPASFAQCGCTLVAHVRPETRCRVKSPEQAQADRGVTL